MPQALSAWHGYTSGLQLHRHNASHCKTTLPVQLALPLVCQAISFLTLRHNACSLLAHPPFQARLIATTHTLAQALVADKLCWLDRPEITAFNTPPPVIKPDTHFSACAACFFFF